MTHVNNKNILLDVYQVFSKCKTQMKQITIVFPHVFNR